MKKILIFLLITTSISFSQEVKNTWKLSGTNLSPINSVWNLTGITNITLSGNLTFQNTANKIMFPNLNLYSSGSGWFVVEGARVIELQARGSIRASADDNLQYYNNSNISRFSLINGNLTLPDPGTSVNSGSISLVADNATTPQTGSIQVMYGANPYMRFSPPNAVGVATAFIDLKSNQMIFPDSTSLTTNTGANDVMLFKAVDNDDGLLYTIAALTGGITPTFDLLAGRLTGTLSGNSQNITGVGQLAATTYGSDGSVSNAELLFINTLSSNAQTQIDTKAPSTSPTFATSITGSYLTASEMLITDGSKNIVSAPVATYPSLTELSYVKGLTSSAQTQITARLPLAGGTMTGNLLFTDNTLDIGASGATRPRTGYFGTSLVSPLLLGGSSTTQDLTLQTTSGVGAAGADMHFLVGNNGATEAMTILNSGNVGIGTTAPENLLTLYATNPVLRFDNANAAKASIDHSNDELRLYGNAISETQQDATKSSLAFTLRPTNDDFTFWRAASGGGAWSSLVTIKGGGNVGIGTTSPTAVLHLKAGTATASTAPLKFTSGTLLTTAEAGAVEFLTDAYYGTITTGAARKTFAFLESPVFTGTVTIPTPFTLGAISVTATGTELNYVAGVTSSIQTQLNSKAPTANPTFTGTMKRSVTATITASTTQTQGQGALTTDVNEVSVVANVNDVVTLPSAVAGMEIFIINNGANTLQIYPASGDNLGAGLNASTTLVSASNVTFVSYNDTNWEIK